MGRPQAVSDDEILAAARRCFLEHGAAVPATEIARAIGVTHTTVFNRFGSKEALMIAALGPPKLLPWAARLDEGPDERPVREQLVEIGLVMSEYFNELAAGMEVLRAAGISQQKIFRGCDVPPPLQAFRALSGWFKRARKQGRIGDVDIGTLTQTMLGALHHRSFTRNVGIEEGASKNWVARFVDLLWTGIEP